MAVIDTPPETVAAAAGTETTGRPAPTGFAAVLGSGDHKVIGRLYIATSLVFAALLLALGLVFGIERIDGNSFDIFSESNVLAWWAFLRLGFVFLVALPLVIGVATAITPLQVGSRAIAFPRAAAAGYWGWAGGSILFLLATLIGGAGGDSDIGQRLYLSALALVIVSILLAAVTIATTVITHRQTGMSTDLVPMFSMSMLAASVLWLLTLPVVLAQLGLAYIDIRHGDGTLVAAGTGLFTSIDWLLRNPQIYVIAIPVLGFAADAIPSAAGRRISPRPAAAASIVIFAVLSLGAFLADAGTNDHKAWIVIGMGVVAVLPVLSIVGLVADMIVRGGLKVNAGALYGAAALLVLLLTVVAGAANAIPALELHGQVADLGVTHGAVIAAVLAGLGGVHWWATKIGRQPAADGLGHIAPLVLFISGVVLVAAELISGLVGDENSIEVSPSWSGGVEALNILVVIGFGLALVGLVLAALSFKPLLTVPDTEVPADPWQGQSLEWASPSPPPLHNFTDDLPEVTSAEPLIDLREEK